MSYIVRDGSGNMVASGSTPRAAWLAARREWVTRHTAYLGRRMDVVPQLRAWRRDVVDVLRWTCVPWAAHEWPTIAG